VPSQGNEDALRRPPECIRFLDGQIRQFPQPFGIRAQLVVDGGLYKGREVFLDLLLAEGVGDELALLDCEPVLIDSVAAEPLDLVIHGLRPSHRHPPARALPEKGEGTNPGCSTEGPASPT
jgi:hypothetical protein